MLAGKLLVPGSENVWLETFAWETVIDEVLLFVTFTLVSASWPTGTLPKLMLPGEKRRPPPFGSIPPDPQPDATIVK
jgi:hypothetical protein